jgi:thiol:disulfide interchange protein DsbC
VDNVTVHVFLYPILSADSAEKSRNIWCSKDRSKTYLDWMIDDITPPPASCDTAAIARNFEFGKRARITGTPAMIFADGSRVPGAIGPERIEKFLTEAKP